MAAENVDVALLSEFVPGSVKVLDVQVNVALAKLTAESKEVRQTCILSVKFIAVLRREVDTDIADEDISPFFIGIFVGRDVARDERRVVIQDIKVRESQWPVITAIVNVGVVRT